MTAGRPGRRCRRRRRSRSRRCCPRSRRRRHGPAWRRPCGRSAESLYVIWNINGRGATITPNRSIDRIGVEVVPPVVVQGCWQRIELSGGSLGSIVVGPVGLWARGARVWSGGGQRVSVVHGLSTRPVGLVPLRRTRPQFHRTLIEPQRCARGARAPRWRHRASAGSPAALVSWSSGTFPMPIQPDNSGATTPDRQFAPDTFVVQGLPDWVELWVAGFAQRPPRVWRRQPGYPQRAGSPFLSRCRWRSQRARHTAPLGTFRSGSGDRVGSSMVKCFS